MGCTILALGFETEQKGRKKKLVRPFLSFLICPDVKSSCSPCFPHHRGLFPLEHRANISTSSLKLPSQVLPHSSEKVANLRGTAFDVILNLAGKACCSAI